MQYAVYVEGVTKTTGGSSGSSLSGSSGSSGSSSSGSGGGRGSSSSGSSGSNGSSSSGSKGGTSSGSKGGNTGGGSKPVTIKKPKDLAKLPPVQVQQPNGSMLAMNMQDFCVLPNANAINTVAYQQCLARKKGGGDDDMPVWLWVLIFGVIIVVIMAIVAIIFTRD